MREQQDEERGKSGEKPDGKGWYFGLSLGFLDRWYPWVLVVAIVLAFSAAILLLLSYKWNDTYLARLAVAAGLSAFLLVAICVSAVGRRNERIQDNLAEYLHHLRSYTVDNIEALRSVVADLPEVSAPQPPEEAPRVEPAMRDTGLKTRERNTLLAIIAALCKEARIDYAKPAAAAATIKNVTMLMGMNVGETTIEEHLKRIPEAIEARSR